MDVLVFVIGLCLISTGIAQDDVFELTKDKPTKSWTPHSSQSIVVQAEKGCQIQLNVTAINVDGENGTYVTVASVNEYEEEQDQLMFTYNISGKLSIIYNSNKMKAVSFFNESSNFPNQVEIHFTRIGEAETTTTTQSTTTTEAMPTPAPEEPATITVYVQGKLFDDAQVKMLRNAIASMGIDYCAEMGCPLNGTITNSNVKIHELQDCPILWNDYEKCRKLTFALPIFTLEDHREEWKGYQLSRSHLENMWNKFAMEKLENVNLSTYSQPDIDKTAKYGLIVICIVTLTLVVLILILRCMVEKIQKKRTKRRNDKSPIINERAYDRDRHYSLTQHYLQEVPSLFYKNGYGGNTSDFHHPTKTDESLTGIINLDETEG